MNPFLFRIAWILQSNCDVIGKLYHLTLPLQSCYKVTKKGSIVFNGITLFKHKGHDGHEGKTKEIKTRFSLCVLGVLRVKAFSRQKRESLYSLCTGTS